MKKVLPFLIFLSLPLLTHAENSVDILMQGETYAPPFYKGATLWTYLSGATLVAVPHIEGVTNPNTLFYKWWRNNTVQGPVNGVGKNAYMLYDTIISKPVTIKIEVLGSDMAVLASNTVTLTPTAPETLVYEKNPLYGFLFNNEVGDAYSIRESEVTFAGFPLFFGTKDRSASQLLYTWRTNDGDKEIKNLVTYRVPDGAKGVASINLQVSNQDKLTQEALKFFSVEFGENQSI